MYIILNWWDADQLVAILTEEDETPLYFESRKAAEKFVVENLSGEYQIVKIHPTTARTVPESRHRNR